MIEPRIPKNKPSIIKGILILVLLAPKHVTQVNIIAADNGTTALDLILCLFIFLKLKIEITPFKITSMNLYNQLIAVIFLQKQC